MNLKGTSIVLFLIAQAFPAISQFKNTMLHDHGKEGPTALSIAVNPRSPANVVAICGPDNVFVTTDGGVNWQKSKITSPMGVVGSPALVSDEKGNFLFVHLSDSALLSGEEDGRTAGVIIQRSGDGGVTWSEGEGVGTDFQGHQRDQWAAVDSRGNLYVTWTQAEGGGDACKKSIFFSMSKNGKKWSDPVSIAREAERCAEGATGGIPAVTYDGKVMVTWSSDKKIMLDRSFNGGEWWLSNDILVSENRAGAEQAIPGHGKCLPRPVLTTDNSKSPYRGSLYVVWADQRNGDSDIWFTRSHNFGDNWSLPQQINREGKGKHQYLPWITVDPATGYIYVLYYDRGSYDDNRTDVYLAWSRDGGASFQNTLVSEKPFVVDEGYAARVYNSISAQKGVIMPMWSRVDDGQVSVWTAAIRQEHLDKKR